jgi:hybrid cluster-associated redox disulfide protein
LNPGGTEHQTVAEIMRRWPATVAVFLRRRLACPGCGFARLMTLGEAAASYGIPLKPFLEELQMAAGGEAAS